MGRQFTIRFACGGILGPIPSDPREDSKDTIRLVTFDTDTDAQRPELDGVTVPCLFRCPAKAKVSGRKLTRCWPEPPPPDDQSVTRWRYVVTCRGKVEAVDDEQIIH